jgi:hypothetical protein
MKLQGFTPSASVVSLKSAQKSDVSIAPFTPSDTFVKPREGGTFKFPSRGTAGKKVLLNIPVFQRKCFTKGIKYSDDSRLPILDFMAVNSLNEFLDKHIGNEGFCYYDAVRQFSHQLQLSASSTNLYATSLYAKLTADRTEWLMPGFNVFESKIKARDDYNNVDLDLSSQHTDQLDSYLINELKAIDIHPREYEYSRSVSNLPDLF